MWATARAILSVVASRLSAGGDGMRRCLDSSGRSYRVRDLTVAGFEPRGRAPTKRERKETDTRAPFVTTTAGLDPFDTNGGWGLHRPGVRTGVHEHRAAAGRLPLPTD